MRVASPGISISHLNGTFVTNEAPKRTCQNHPTLYFAVQFILVWTVCGFGHCWMMCCHHYGIIQFLLDYKQIWVLPVHTSDFYLATELFIASIVLPFPECHVVGIIKYVVFSDWLFFLSNTHLRFLHVFSWLIAHSFYSIVRYSRYSIVCMYHGLFNHSHTERGNYYFFLLSGKDWKIFTFYFTIKAQLQFLSPLQMDFLGSSVVKNPPASAAAAKSLQSCPTVRPHRAGDARYAGLICASGRSPGGGNGSPLQCSCLENPMDRGAWWATVHGVTKSRTRLSDSARMHTDGAAEGVVFMSPCVHKGTCPWAIHVGESMLTPSHPTFLSCWC